MWSYYGRKSKLVHLYPSPKFDTIIEPFAGTAVYSLYGNNWQKDVILVEKYEVIVRIWKYLQQAKSEDILGLPILTKGESLDNFQQLAPEEKWLIGFCINRGSSTPKKTAQKFNSWESNREVIAKDLYKIKHWKIQEGSYEQLTNMEATWFIDPPYQKQGKYYRHNANSIDFTHLANYCKNREGEVIVCENMGADWLDFIPLSEFRGQKNKNTEAIWYK
jgi:hypothetical protein